MAEVVIVGGGAAGMMAGIMLAEKGHRPVIYEKNEKLGKKLFITGKGRCNLTNNCDVSELFKNVVSNEKFMYSSFYGFDSAQTMRFFEGLGLKLKTERGGRVFPESDHSSDVIGALVTRLKRLNVKLCLGTEVTEIVAEDVENDSVKASDTVSDSNLSQRSDSGAVRHVRGIRIRQADGSASFTACEHVVVATGGLSYPLTGSTGDGIRWAKTLGLKVTDARPALVPMNIREKLCADLMGLTLKNIGLSLVAHAGDKKKPKILYEGMGEMLFTHFGVSGPLVLTASSCIGKYAESDLRLYIDMKPALSEEQLDSRILRDFSENMNKQLRNALHDLLPKNMISFIIEQSGTDTYKKVNEISREERMRLVHTCKHFELHVKGVRGFDEAIITQGGVSVREINPGTMESKQIGGLYFIGEVLDVDALTGGFNLQIAWSTAAALSF